MKIAKLVTHGNYGTVFSSEELLKEKKSMNFVGNIKNISFGEEENLIYEVATSELGLKNIVLNSNQKEIVNLLLKEKKDLSIIKKFNLPVTSKLLLYGPPGTGKTLSAYCIAGELKKKIFVVNLANLIASKLGETSKNIDKVFARAKNENAILFIDEFDAISRTRESSNEHGEMKRTVNVLLQILDLIGENVLVIGATNRLEDMDEAILRRFDHKIYYPMPSKEQIELYLSFLEFSYNFKFKNKDIKKKHIELLYKKSYSDIQNTYINLLKYKIFTSKKLSDIIIIDEKDIEKI